MIDITIMDIPFIVIAVVTIISAIFALESKEIVYGAVSLAISFVGMAAFFLLLDAAFLAMFQITVYIGAVIVLILFTVMLVRREKWMTEVKSNRLKIMGIIAGIVIVSLFGIIFYNVSEFFPILIENSGFTIADVGLKTINDYWFVAEVLALLLTISLIGALTLAKIERRSK
jgi:NADH-quinone oxidoreductase subunit J